MTSAVVRVSGRQSGTKESVLQEFSSVRPGYEKKLKHSYSYFN